MAQCNETKFITEYRKLWAAYKAGQISAFQFADWVKKQGVSTTTTSVLPPGTTPGDTPFFSYTVTIYPPPQPVPCPPELPPPGACDTRTRDLLRDYLRNSGYEVNAPYVYNTEQARRLAKRIVDDIYGANNSRIITVPVEYPLDVNSRVKFRDSNGKMFYGRVHMVEINCTDGQATKTLALYKVRPAEGTNDG